MSTITSFEELEIWQKGRELCKVIHTFIQRQNFYKDFALTNQIKRSSGSVMDNIAEGFERSGKNEFIQFLSISKGSLGETRSQLYRAFDCGYISNEELNEFVSTTKELGNQIGNFIKYLKSSDNPGSKFFGRTTSTNKKQPVTRNPQPTIKNL